MGWAASPELTKALGRRAPCGCQSAERAASIDDQDAREEELAAAREASRDWLCPRVGCRPDPDALGDGPREALTAIERLTGHRFTTCPYAGAYEGWTYRAVEADELGYANVRAAYGSLPGTLVQAAQVVRRARQRRENEELRVMREEFERSKKRGDS